MGYHLANGVFGSTGYLRAQDHPNSTKCTEIIHADLLYELFIIILEY